MVRFTMQRAILLAVFHVVWSEIGFESPTSQAFLADVGLDKIVSDQATPFLTLVAEDGDKTDGDKKDDQKIDGDKKDDQKTDGDKNTGQKMDGDKAEDPKPDGEKPAEQTDGNKPPEQETDGNKPPDQQTDGNDKPPEQQTDGGKTEDPKPDGEKPAKQTDGNKPPEQETDGNKPPDQQTDGNDKPPEQQTDGGKTDDQKPDDDKTQDNSPEEPGTGGNPEEECAAKLTFKVQVTILGKLGYSNANPSKEEKTEMKDKASKWIFSTLLRSMMRNAEQYKLGEKAVPTIAVTTKEPFEATEHGQRSPLERTILDYVFPDTDVCSAAAFGRFLCRDYDSAEEELLTGVLRSLDVAAQYPAAAMQMASKSGLGPKSLITLAAASLEGESTSNFCNWGTKFSSDSVQGALMMPDCPENSVRCEDRENLCTAEEAKWKCKCTFGYEGDPKIPGLEQGSIEGPFHIEGECKPISGYCESGKHPMKLEDGSDAKGVLGESAIPFCGDGFEASGISECTEGENVESRKGRWSPEPRCNYLPSTVPGEPFCKTPEHGGTLALEQCSLCMGVEPGKKGPECNCEVNCAQGHKQMGEIAGGKKECVASEFACPKAVLADGRCLDAKSNEVTHFFCCDESWGPNVPPDNLAATVCSDIKEDKECLTLVQSASGADAGKAGEPCCWSRSTRSCSVKSQEQQSPCAVAKRVMVADWKDLPTCVPPCEDVFGTGVLDSEGCDTCYPPGAKADSCKCKVSCHMGMVRIGGGPDGDRTCKADGNGGFGFGLAPVCWPKPAPASCPSVEGTGRKVEGCDCQAGQENCKCSVTCQDGFAKTSDGVTSPQCHEKPLQSEVKDCRAISDASECLKSFAAKADGEAAAVPCCLRQEKDYANGVSCIPAGDPEISQDKLPDSCAPVTYAEWDELPVCTPLCNADSLKWKDHVAVDPTCDACIAGQDCDCSVDCEAGFVRVGGGLTGKRSCTVEALSLGAAPVCRQAQAGEPGVMPTCPQPDVADATGDCRCEASPDGCVCPVFCKHTHGNIKENVQEGDKKCTIEDKMPPAGTCNSFTTKDECLSHSQDGEPCCFREDGLYAKCDEGGNCEADKAVVCAARYDEKIFFSPTDCAKSLFPKWEEMPDCQPKCVMPPSFSEARHVSASEACSGCIAGQACACEIKCEDNFERVGGGPEGPRSCEISKLDFEEAPLCQAKEATPDCPAVKSTEAMVASDDCSSCTAEEECDCQVSCATGYAPFTDVQPGNKKCHIDPDYALKPGSCASLTGQDECLAGSEDGVPCCWRGAGFKDEKKCAKKGSSDILLSTPPDSCAPTRKGKMDPLPVCKQLCVNQFSTAPNVNEENCDGCFVGEPCECFVKCEVEMVERAGQKGKKKCGDDPNNPTSFGEPLVCEPRKPPEVPSCKTPQNSFFQYDIEGCKNCKAGDDGCSCSVKCAEGHKKTSGGEPGPKKCLSKVYECPISVTWKPEALQCFDTTSNEKVDTFCCPEAVEDKPELDASKECTALTDEKGCLKGKDMTTAKACCWRDTGFADGNKCAAHGSSAITNDHRAIACADRGRILHAYYEELPECTKKCRNPYKATSRQSREGSFGLTVSGCEDCVPGEKECPCKVTCVQDWIRVGGGKEDTDKPRMCDDKSVFPLAPTCMSKPDPPKCQKPSGYGYKVKGCESCTPGEPCDCSVQCNRGLDASAGTLGEKACELKPASLTEAQCSDLTGRSQCLSSWESKVPCCYRKDGFQNGKVCAKQGDEAIQDLPDSCAPLEMGQFPDLPKCVPICTYSRLQGRSWKSEGSCDHCLADAPCDCQMKCQDGYEFIGGSPPGPRGCTTAEPELPPPPVCQKIKPVECREPDKGSLKKVALSFCETCVAGDDSCRCTAKCARDRSMWDTTHIVKPGSSIQEGLKKCLAEDVTGNTACEEITSKSSCIESVYNGKRCCWQKDRSGTGQCWTEGSPKILKGGVSKPVCSDLKVGKFEEFPECVPACRHRWKDRVGLAYDEKACRQCTPVKYPGVEDCTCSVKCAADFRFVGAGPEGLRSCEGDVLKRFEQGPACVKKSEPPVCERKYLPGQIMTGCDCKVGQENCPCSVKCEEGFSVTSGQIGDMACIEVPNDNLKTASCSGSWGKSQCMSRQEMVDGELKPCCWRFAGFSSSLTRCVPEGHELIIEATPPDECAPATKGVFRPLLPSGNILKDNPPLVCTPFCKNIFEKKKDLDHSGCDSCQPNEDCPCTVKCRSPLKALAGNEGKRECLLVGGRAEFQPPPSCVKPCETPDNLQGTLDVSECDKNCVPGDRDCTCIVKCAAGNFRVDGGQEGEKPCVATSHGPMHTDLPICLPKCVKPEDQFGSLNTKKCASCLANRRCDCDLSCYTKASKKGALNGKKKCEFIPGSKDKSAAAEWAPADGNGPNGVPQCLPPIIIKVDDARTKKPLDGVTIVISVPYASGSGLRRPIETLYTSKSTRKDMAVEFSTEQRDIYVELKKKGYATITRALDRGKNCKDASKCEFHFALSEELKGGHLSPNGCFIVGNPKTIEWDMRAVLEWGETPADLDIWARNYDCYRDVEKAYDCTGKNPTTFEETYLGWTSRYTKCKRRLFRQRSVRNKEIEACGVRFCSQDEQRTAFSKYGKPLCKSYNQKAYNQYDKWVFWDVRYASDMQKRCYRSGIEDSYPKINCNGWARHAKDWNEDHHMVLDVDEQSGHGPETISFKNVPPGTYQVVVNQWTTTSRKVRDRWGNKIAVEDVGYANPRVNLYIGGNSIRFECLIPDSCLSQVRIWNVVNVEVKDIGPYENGKNGERKYQIRLIDSRDEIQPLRWVEMPTRRDNKKQEWTQQDTQNQQYWTMGTATEYPDGYLKQACVGQCEPADAEYKECMARTHSRRLAEDLSNLTRS